MKWTETTASSCRYGDVAGRIFSQAEVLWEHSEDDYQGFANILAAMPDGTFVHYEWTYGSCPGCDEWESRNLTDDQVEQEMRGAMAILADKETLRRYLHLEGVFADAQLPTANTPTNGSIPGMMQYIGGGWGKDFGDMREVVGAWLDAQAVQP